MYVSRTKIPSIGHSTFCLLFVRWRTGFSMSWKVCLPCMLTHSLSLKYLNPEWFLMDAIWKPFTPPSWVVHACNYSDDLLKQVYVLYTLNMVAGFYSLVSGINDPISFRTMFMEHIRSPCKPISRLPRKEIFVEKVQFELGCTSLPLIYNRSLIDGTI